MKPERWQQINDIFLSAAEGPPQERTAFLEEACHGDEGLRREVESLIACDERAENFIESPALEVALELLTNYRAGAMVGESIGHYRIESLIGAGGMGEVYLARDERLGRKVALKLLPERLTADETQLSRFKTEARMASALNHPNILTVYEIGAEGDRQFIATEFIEGMTLRASLARGKMNLHDALEIAVQVASALAAAHETGIVHRDIKPENIMLRPDGYAKVLDFGIAKLAEQTEPAPRAEGPRSAPGQTQSGLVLGTAHYMSPEQALGKTVDARTDIWSFGVVLYEMLAGRPPFEGETRSDCIASVRKTEPPPLAFQAPKLPARLEQIVRKALRKDKAQRYQSAEEMLSDLRAVKEALEIQLSAPRKRVKKVALWLGLAALCLIAIAGWYFRAHPPPAVLHPPSPQVATIRQKTIAVLPFENLSPEKEDAFFAAGIQDDLLTTLGKIKELKVIGRTSVMTYRQARASEKLREIGQTLGVSHVLEGSVRRSANRVVINVALLDTRDERQVWSERYERALTDALSLQGELAVEIAHALRANLTLAEKTNLATRPTENLDAYILYLRARELETRFGAGDADSEAAINLYQQALDLDPNFALARARLSIAISSLTQGEDLSRKAKAQTEAEEALRRRPDLGEARLAVAYCYFYWNKDYDRALLELSRAAELMPSSSEVPLTAAFIYKSQNKFRERIAALERAVTLDPRDTHAWNRLYLTFRWVRNWPEAVRARDHVRTLLPPNDLGKGLSFGRAWDEFRMTGDIDSLKKLIAKPPAGVAWEEIILLRYQVAVLERDYPAAQRFLSEIPPKVFEFFPWKHPKSVEEASLTVASGADRSTVEGAVESARQEIEKILSEPPHPSTQTWELHSNLGLLYAFVGRKEDAIREGRRGLELNPGPLEKNDSLAALALIHARVGESDEAVRLIEHLLTVPAELPGSEMYAMTLTELKWRWQWDPLRSHPRFQKILAAAEPKTVY